MRRSLQFWPLLATIFFAVSGGPYGLEPTFQAGKGLGLLLVLITPLVWAYPAALMSAELAAAIPEEGGYYVWVKQALGPFSAYLCGWSTWLYAWVDVAIYPGLFAINLANLLGILGYDLPLEHRPGLKWILGLLIIVPFTWLNIRGTKKVGQTSLVFFAILVCPFIIMVLMGLPKLFAHPLSVWNPIFEPAKPISDALSVGLFSVMWNYLGWDSITTVSAEVEQPERTMPRALLAGVAIVSACYFLPSFVGLAYRPNPEDWTEGSWSSLAVLIGGKGLGVFVAAAGLLSAAGLFSATLLASSRIPFVLAQDGYLPRGVAQLSNRYGTPTLAILVSAIFYTIFSYSSFENLKIVDVILYSFALGFEFVALIVLRVRQPDLARPYCIPGGYLGLVAVCFPPMLLVVFAIYSQAMTTHGEALKLTAICIAAVAMSYPLVKKFIRA